jgi:2-polyprenyl-6-methoxyphenol hydroxylase-like FAD-dependent oxidoreductase
MSFDWVVLADGFRSRLRSQTSIKMLGTNEILHFLNIHFESPKLARAIEAKGVNAMLHFVYNSDVTCFSSRSSPVWSTTPTIKESLYFRSLSP